ncbi:MAG: glutamate--tRNA ligase family protein [Phycisphaerales bacterium]|jgi:glutamyl-tRNA synthetase|nr:glutamate--tRNA ligase family protein [Phycisphaerales bacterium]
MNHRRSRIAPSPTGSLHLGNAFAFLVNWAIARNKGWELILRIEDLDGPRIKPETINETIDILAWLGIDWDGDVHIQSDEIQHAREILIDLIDNHLAYHCNLTRSELEEASSAPHAKSKQLSEITRPKNIATHNTNIETANKNWRFVSNNFASSFQDELCGLQTFDNLQDFVIWTKNNIPSYQLAVVVDDQRQGITDVVRGNDLLESAAWQEQLYCAMNWNKPRWWHLPLIVGNDNKRLAKRHGDTRIVTYKKNGVKPDRIIGLIATWCGIQNYREPMNRDTFLNLFDIYKLPKSNIAYTNEDEKWLLD